MLANCKESEFVDQVFASASYIELVVTGVEFHNCTFENLQIPQVEFIRCKFVDCIFRGCDLSNMVVKGSTFRDTKFEKSKIIGVNWTNATMITHVNFLSCIMNFANFTNVDLRKSRIEYCIGREMDFAHANLTEASCVGTDLAGTRFLQTNLTKADFRDATSYAIRPNDNTLKKAKFSLPEATSLLYGLDIELQS